MSKENDELYNVKITIEEAKVILRERIEKGADCPCCNQFVKKYKRKLNSGMAITLARIYQHHRQEFIDVKDFLRLHKFTNSHDWTLLKHWKFLKTDADGRKWQITDVGVFWLLTENAKTWSHISMYNNKFMGFSKETITFKKALSNHFDYDELMNALGGETS